MTKLILENKSDLSMTAFLQLAIKVIELGRVSNDEKQFCYLVSINIENQEYHIVSDLNEKSDKLTIYKV